jgi:hypothetical protein
MDRVATSDRNFVEPLQELILRCQSPDGNLDFDLRWTAAFPAVQEEPHLLLAGSRPILDASRFCQMGNWSGRLRVGDREFAVSPGQWTGARDRSWGIRPIGEPEPPGRAATEPMEGFWWLYAPLRFESCAVIVILQENPDGYRTVNDAKRVWKDGRLEQLGWPQADIRYRAGTRHPEAARLHLADRAGNPLTVEVETVTSVPGGLGAIRARQHWPARPDRIRGLVFCCTLSRNIMVRRLAADRAQDLRSMQAASRRLATVRIFVHSACRASLMHPSCGEGRLPAPAPAPRSRPGRRTRPRAPAGNSRRTACKCS